MADCNAAVERLQRDLTALKDEQWAAQIAHVKKPCDRLHELLKILEKRIEYAETQLREYEWQCDFCHLDMEICDCDRQGSNRHAHWQKIDIAPENL